MLREYEKMVKEYRKLKLLVKNEETLSMEQSNEYLYFKANTPKLSRRGSSHRSRMTSVRRNSNASLEGVPSLENVSHSSDDDSSEYYTEKMECLIANDEPLQLSILEMMFSST